jgi:hypothetical protein
LILDNRVQLGLNQVLFNSGDVFNWCANVFRNDVFDESRSDFGDSFDSTNIFDVAASFGNANLRGDVFNTANTATTNPASTTATATATTTPALIISRLWLAPAARESRGGCSWWHHAIA